MGRVLCVVSAVVRRYELMCLVRRQVLTSKEITDSMSSMYINDTGVGLANFSDHNWITVNLTTPALIQLENRTYNNTGWNINNKTDWDNFKNVLD